jgi:PAS domain S-box-containing protein
VEASPDSLVITDRSGVIAMVNAQTEKRFGYRREELVGQAVEILVPDRFRRKHVAQRDAYLGNPHVLPMGGRVNLFGRHRDGHEFPVEIGLSPVETEEGLLIAAAVRDVSERERLMRELRDSESMYRLLAENSTDLISRHDLEGIYLYASPACRSLLGFGPEELVGRSAYELIHPDDRDEVARVHSAILARPEPLTISFRILHKDGFFSWCESSARAVRDPGTGDILDIQCVTRDISERKQVEDALRDSEERTRSIVNHVIDGIITIDATGMIQSFNPAVERLFGYRADELIGRNVNILMPEPYHGEHDGYIANYLRTGQSKVIGLGREAEGRRKDGTTFPLELSVSEFSLAGTRMFTGVARDITDRERRRQRVAAEHGAARVLAESRTISDAAPRLIKAIAGNLGWEVGGLWQIDQATNVLRCVEFWQTPSSTFSEFEAVSRRLAIESGVGLTGRVWESGKVTWVSDVTADANFPRAYVAAKEGLHWGIALPIKSSEGTLGVIDFYRRQGEEPDDPLLQMFESITSQIARFIEHRNTEQRIVERQTEIDLAQRVQLGFFPRAQPNLEGFSIAGASRPAQETGGDYFDFIPFPHGHLMIPLGDVSGHGLGAAIIMAETRAYVRALGLSGMHLGTILNFANSRLIEDTNGEHFMTLFLALLNPYSRSLVYSNAGQVPGYIFDRKGDLKTTLDSTDIPLGFEPDWVFHNDRATMLESGDLVLLMSDGILEARSSDVGLFGAERAIEVVLRHRREEPSVIIEHLIREACTFCRNVQVDDMTAVVIEVE